MTEKAPNSGLGKYMPLFHIAGNFVILNIALVVMFYCVKYNPGVLSFRTAWLLGNLAYVPEAYWSVRRQHRRRTMPLDRLVLFTIGYVIVFILLYISMTTFVRSTLELSRYAALFGMLIVAMPLWEVVSRSMVKAFRARGRNYARVVIVGANRTGLRLAEQMRADAGYGYRLMGFFDEDKPNNFSENYLGNIQSMNDYVRENKIDEIYFALPGERRDDLSTVVKIADDNIVTFYYVPMISRYVRRNFDLISVGEMPVLAIRRNPLKSTINRFIKRSFDIAFSSAFLLVSPVIFIPVAIAVKLSSPGPVFFRQERTGYRGKSFKCLKFRTMRVNVKADELQATKDDPRKTAIGDFMRRTSIDELPQFINVWLGDMSIVGPRPHMLKHTDDYSRLIDKYMVRHVVKPGITGWAQVNGYRGLTDELWKMERRVEFDVWYIEHWTFMLDIKIVVRTVLNALGGEKNAF